MDEHKIISATLAPVGLLARFEPVGEHEGHTETVAALALIETADGCGGMEREIVAMIIDPDFGTLTPANEACNFDRLLWQESPACKCSAN